VFYDAGGDALGAAPMSLFLPIAFRLSGTHRRKLHIVIKSRNAICFAKMNAKVIALRLVI
jgi:hypothetical protein